MFSKIIFILATVCIVNASVLTINVFNDDPETEVASNPKDCNVQACNQLCYRLKFHGSVCVNGRCKCDNFLNAEDEVSEETLSDLEDSALQTDDLKTEVTAKSSKCNLTACDLVCSWLKKTSGSCVNDRCKCAKSLVAEDELPENSLSNLEDSVLQQDPETKVENKKSDCNNQECDQLCRRLKFPGGACVNNRCKCDNFLNAEVFAELLSNPEDSVSPRACNNQKCYDLCRKIKLQGGACIDGKCICNNYLSGQEDDMTDPAEFLSRDSCNFRACDQQCFRFGHSGGACENGRCKCNNFLNTEVSESNKEDSVSSRACNNKKCDQLCRKQKFRGGACLGANCYCNKFYSLLEDIMTDSVESLPLSSCNTIACNDQCQRNGWHSGVCINGQCKCDYFLNTEVSENSISNLEDFVSPRKCNHQECNAQCRRLLFREGVCIAGRCSCNNYIPIPKDTMNDLEESISLDDNFLSTEDAVDEYSELAPRRVRRLTKCNRKCIRRGYEGATCVNGRCKCYKNLQEKDSSPLNDVTSNKNEESNVILRIVEEELAVPSPSACNTVTCN